jgi:molybdate transport system regulatory protein
MSAGRPAFGPGKAALIECIQSTGSISSAARVLGMSYRRAWQLVEALNQSFAKPVVVTAIGGKRGGGAHVTAFGKRLVKLHRVMENRASAAIAGDLRRFSKSLRKAPGRHNSR